MDEKTTAKLEQFKSGDQAAFRYFYDKYSASVCYFIGRFIGVDADAEDINHDVFVNLWNSRATIDSEYHLSMFLYQSARHRCLNYFRQKKTDDKYRRGLTDLLDSDEGYTGAVIEEEVHRMVWEEIERLPEEQRKVIILHLEGKDNAQIAEILRVSINTVRTHKARARKTLRETLDHLMIFMAYLNI